ncbi:MAG: type II CAAX endopeptidase family protein [Candidatus Krumholzibacteriota bacterium]|nr:type II CAAX endopeptidase family protein [Candidatus Krumholzibacteriota bacterium]
MPRYEKNYPDENKLPDLKPSIFDLINNYLLLSYSAACFMIYFSVSSILYFNNWIILSIILPGLIAFVLPLYLLAKRFSTGFLYEYRIKSPDSSIAVLVMLIALSAILPVDALSSYFEQYRSVDADYTNLLISIKPKGPASFLAAAFGLVIAAPFSEELLFRGFIQRIMQRNTRKILAVILSGVIFGASHFDLTLIPGIAVLGIILGYIFLRTGNLFYSFSAHALYNFISLLRLHYTSEADIKSGEIASPSGSWVLLSILVFFLAIYLFETKTANGEN